MRHDGGTRHAAILAIAAIAIAGCGGSDDAGVAATAPQAAAEPETTRAEFVRAADRHCKRTNGRLAKARQRVLVSHGYELPEGGGTIDVPLAVAAEQYRKSAKMLRANDPIDLEPPQRDVEAVEAYRRITDKNRKLTERAASVLTRGAKADASGDSERATRASDRVSDIVETLKKLSLKRYRKTKHLGFKECARKPS